MPVKLDKNGWPVELIVPSVNEFIQGTWYEAGPAAMALVSKAVTEDVAIKRVASDYHCGTQCCLVGWMGVAFDGPMMPHEAVHRGLSEAQREFALEFLRSADVEDEYYDDSEYLDDIELLRRCSDTFEDVYNGKHGEFARKHWIAAGEACGYDLSAFKNKRGK